MPPGPSPYPTAAADLTSARLEILSRDPANAETRLDAHPELLTPQGAFYKRNHYAIPALTQAGWRLSVGGAVGRPLDLGYDEMRALPSRSEMVTLECAGNGRAGFQPPAEGEPWGYGAVSTAEWSGVSCAAVLERAQVSPSAREIVFVGADSGPAPGSSQAEPFVRSLPVAEAMRAEVLLAYAMNGAPLPPEHGFPVRLIVPGWYGMAAVKWVTKIEATVESFQGYFQVDRYVMAHPERGETTRTPLTVVPVRSLIAEPRVGANLRGPSHLIRGFAWSGAAPIAGVEVSLDDGAAWQPATLSPEAGRYTWRQWTYAWHVSRAGLHSLRCRATDAEGNTQPSEPEWNRLGYANNAIHSTHVTVAL
jgi:DMSO/TMAO reductase YedYZ molybdopterin-dependent catalytic subunit